MTQLLRLSRRPRKGQIRVFTVDRPRTIDPVIDFFGDRRPRAAAVIPRLAKIPQARVSRG